MRRPRRKGPVFYALCANAALLLAILLALVGRGNASFIPSAMAAGAVQPIAGGGGIFLMPGQFSTSTWGCYVMDVDAQTLCAYQWFADKKLRLVAARSFKHDRQLHDFNTDNPTPADVAKLIELERTGRRDRPQPQPEQPQEQPQEGDPAPEGKP